MKFSPWHPNRPLNNTFGLLFSKLSGWSNLTKFIQIPGHSCIRLTALPCPNSSLAINGRGDIEDSKAHIAAWGPKCGAGVRGRIWGSSHQIPWATQITSFKQMLNPSRKGTTAKQSVLLFSGSHCGYCPGPFLIWSRIHSGIPFITALAQIKLFPPAHTNWHC